MSNPNTPDPQPTPESNESFSDLLSEFERSHARKSDDGSRQLEGTVITVNAESIFLDVGYKIEGVLPVSALQGTEVKPGDKIPVSIKGRNEEGYYELSRLKIAQPTDWSSLERAFAEGANIVGTVTGAIKGGVTVDVGVRAFMPASRTGTRDAAEMEKLVGQQITCRILKLDVTEEDVVVDRRAVLEEERRTAGEQKFSEVREGDTVEGTVRSLTDYGAFVDLGGVDGLLHVSDISWSRVNNPGDVLSVGQKVQARVLKIDAEKRRISLGLKQLQAHPWEDVGAKYKSGDRVRGTVTRTTDFGAFVELEPGIEGMIHVSEMSWVKKVRKPSDVVKQGDSVEAVVLGVQAEEKRISLGLKQALGDPWAAAIKTLHVGTQIEGPVTSMTKFGAFIQVAEGVEGMVHVSEMAVDKHVHHPQDELRLGQQVKALIIAIDPEKRQMRLSMKQLVPTSLDEYLAEHAVGDVVTGRLVEGNSERARVELGEGVFAECRLEAATKQDAASEPSRADLSSLTSMLQARWKGTSAQGPAKSEALRAGQIRDFRITRLDAEAKRVEVELATR